MVGRGRAAVAVLRRALPEAVRYLSGLRRRAWLLALRGALSAEAGALRQTEGRVAFAGACLPIVLVAGPLWIAGPLSTYLRNPKDTTLLETLWAEPPADVSLLMVVAWAMAAACVALMGCRAKGVPADASVRHAQLVARTLMLQAPGLLFLVPALGLGGVLLSVVARLVAILALALSTAGVAVLLECVSPSLRAPRAAALGAGALMLAAAWYGPAHFTVTRALLYRALFPTTAWGRLELAYILFALSLNGIVGTLAACLVAVWQRAGGLSWRALLETLTGVPGERWRVPDLGLAREIARRPRRPWRLVPILLFVAALPLFVLVAPLAQWLATTPGTAWLPLLLGFPVSTPVPYPDGSAWHWSNSTGYALLAGAAAWSALLGRLVLPALVTPRATRERRTGRLEALLATRLTSLEVLLALWIPGTVPAVFLCVIALLPAAVIAYYQGTPGALVVLIALGALLAVAVPPLVSLAVGLRVRASIGATSAAYVALLLVPGFSFLLAPERPSPVGGGLPGAHGRGLEFTASLVTFHWAYLAILVLAGVAGLVLAMHALCHPSD